MRCFLLPHTRVARAAVLGCLAIFPPVSLHAREKGVARVDSLRSVLQVRRNIVDTALVNLHLALSEAYSTFNPTLGSRHADSALQMARGMGFTRGEGDASHWLGWHADSRADYAKALEHYFEALRIREAAGDTRGVARTQANIGVVFAAKDSFQKARVYFEKAYSSYKRLRDTAGMARRLEGIGELYEKKGALDTAQWMYERTATLARLIGDKDIEADAVGSVGLVLNRRGEYEEAIQQCQLALRLCESIGNRFGVVRHMGNIGGCYYDAAVDRDNDVPPSPHIPASREARLQLAIRYLRQAVDSAEALGHLKAVEHFSQWLSDAYEASGNTALAFASYRRHIAARDSIHSVESDTRIAQLENEHELLLRDKQIELDRLAISKKRDERIYFIAGLALLGVVTFFIARERKKSERLLLNILPHKIAVRLKSREHPIADSFAGVSIIFIDMVHFTELAERCGPKETVSILNDIFTRFDFLAEEYGLEKIKTIGDSYMAVAGLPEPRTDHADRAAAMALAARRVMHDYRRPDGERILFRIGLDCGPVVAGVIGRKKFIYDLWGDAVNTAARMESSGVVDEIQCTDNFRRCVSGRYDFTPLGRHVVKGKGEMETWLLREAVTPGQSLGMQTS